MATTTSLSEDEFHRMQIQLLELRTENYTLEDTSKRQGRELQALNEKLQALEKDLQKANKTISKSKKAKEVELLLQENDSLQKKLLSQEDDFRLSNNTIMQELNSYITANETLEKQIKSFQEGDSGGGTNASSSEVQEEICQLQAQNAALQKNLSSQSSEFETELGRQRETIRLLQEVNADLEAQCTKQRGTPAGDDNTSGDLRTVEGQSDNETSLDQTDGEIDPDESMSRLRNASFLELVSHTEFNNEKLQANMKEIQDLKLKLDTQLEENKIIKEKMKSVQCDTKETSESLQVEVDRLTEKLKKKQESFVHLQEEKEKMYTEFSKKLEELQNSKDSEYAILMEQNTKLQEELFNSNKAMEDLKGKSYKRIQDLEAALNELNEQVDEASIEATQQMQEENEEIQHKANELEKRVKDSLYTIEDLRLQLKESQKACSQTLEQLTDSQIERDKLIVNLQDMSRTAEKRKMLLDEFAIKYQQEQESHREDCKNMGEKHKSDVAELDKKLMSEKAKSQELDKIKSKYEEIKSQVQSLEEAKGWLERRLREAEENLKNAEDRHASEVKELENKHEEHVSQLRVEHEQKLANVQAEVEKMKTEKKELESQISKLRQEIEDGVESRKLHEKKGASLLKDLKRQVHAERKRAEKLQERLQEILSADNKSSKSMEDLLFRNIDENRYRGDNSSVSSYTMSNLSKDPMSSNMSQLSATSPSDETPPNSIYEQDNEELLQRIGSFQQEKWMLEEKVAHLESSTAAMAEDLLNKTAIIEHYVMDTKIGPLLSASNHSGTLVKDSNVISPSNEKITFKKVMDFVKEKGDSDLRDMNRKLQRVLEETLTKNMHLQKDMETLSQEIVRLSKDPKAVDAVK